MLSYKNIVKCATIASLMTLSLVANAGSIAANGVEIQRVGCGASTIACFAIVAAPVGPPACNSLLVSFDATTTSGKNALATLLTIKAAGFTANLTLDDTICNGANPKLIAVTAN